ncbi:MAG: FMN-binding negative transcriptional regulator [Alphaproteobacteria bacterium]|uniref:Negative transcriptional regulator, PaiB family n=1 Tax=Celeribacter baekdonensis TaxID=875171 RepID=A0A1G7I314_9RHOB|nr:FMN-binding negative transcriptional regulator [Celeribacter baekdonensis]MBU0644948.1 FMN-binding negative transcriptional regulator [Alphaproteobacteria bacterium]MBU1281038.1 FMN-binding negative transcriptional regulator [Alphaproteobacteria bacterium]MBU1575006.1 FMN-binding negative transcriptional regulator [Alphaproteobacteria bacterium]MBU1826860.1 FMN-binding negative transcriptional regulator [Alphaproteobacteria bacterium]MBU2079067.1 FMN-binding negative transcriptional regulat
MYTPNNSAINDPATLAHVMTEISFGALITPTAEGIEISHLPWIVREEGGRVILESHVARPNPHWKLAGAGSVVMFQGPQAYVSPSFYPSKQVDGKVVPTWAYIVVHAHGMFESFNGAEELHAHLRDLTHRHEAGRAEPWAMSDAPVPYLAALKRGIIGLRFTVDRLEGKWKVNQHKSTADRQGSYEGLMASGEQGVDLAQALASFPASQD